MKSALLLLALVWASGAPQTFCQEPKAAEQKKVAVLTAEEREMLHDRELLENLELLQSLDKIQYLDLFIERDTKKAESPAAVQTKKKTEREK